MEKRIPKPPGSAAATRSSPLPVDYTRMIEEVFTSHYEPGLKELAKIAPAGKFKVSGQIYPDEILVTITLSHKGQMSATSAHASADFDPRQSSPTVQDLLGACVDAIGAVFDQLLDPAHPERLAQVAEQTLSAFEDIPFQWTEIDVNKRRIYVMVDKSNPELDELAEDWLKKNDPDYEELERKNQEEAEKLFVTGPRDRDKKGSGIH